LASASELELELAPEWRWGSALVAD
jgi:hypothetical protein